jgi:hypothetical protein
VHEREGPTNCYRADYPEAETVFGPGDFCVLRLPAITLDQFAGAPDCFSGCASGEGVDRGERISDPGEIRKRRGVDREEFCSCGLAREADIGERDRVADSLCAWRPPKYLQHIRDVTDLLKPLCDIVNWVNSSQLLRPIPIKCQP